MRVPFVFPTSKQNLSSFFRILNSINHFLALRNLRSTLLVLRSQNLKFILYLMPVVRPIIVLFVQDQPNLKAWIRSSNSDTVGFAKTHSFFKSLMFVSIKHGPHLIPCLKQVPSPLAIGRQS